MRCTDCLEVIEAEVFYCGYCEAPLCDDCLFDHEDDCMGVNP